MQFTGCVRDDGSVRLDDKPRWNEALKKLKGKRILLELEYEKAKRSSPQNRRFFGVIVPVARECLNRELEKRECDTRLSKEDTHTWIDGRFLGFEETPLGRFRKHCSDLNTADFSRFCEEVELYFMETFGASFDADEEMVREAM